MLLLLLAVVAQLGAETNPQMKLSWRLEHHQSSKSCRKQGAGLITRTCKCLLVIHAGEHREAYSSSASGPLLVMNGLPLESPRPLAWTSPTCLLLAGLQPRKRATTAERGTCNAKQWQFRRHDSKGTRSLTSGQAVLGIVQTLIKLRTKPASM